MLLTKIGTWTAAILGMAAIAGGAYAFGDRFGFRPALISEVRDVEQMAAANSRQLLWLQLDNFERVKKRRRLTRKECARYLAIARQLGVPAKC